MNECKAIAIIPPVDILVIEESKPKPDERRDFRDVFFEACMSARWRIRMLDFTFEGEILREFPESGKELYAMYLQTGHWHRMRAMALKAAGHACHLCRSVSNLQVHHRDYSRLGQEDLRDLVVLCLWCHGRHHGVLA